MSWTPPRQSHRWPISSLLFMALTCLALPGPLAADGGITRAPDGAESVIPETVLPETVAAETVIAQAIVALGGAERWQAIDSMELRGDYSTFSTTYPFRILRQRPNLYRFEHYEADMQVIVAFDGSKAWWHNQLPLFAGVTWPTAPAIPYARGFEADAEFAGWPFLDAAERGHRLTSLGNADLEGIDTRAVEIGLANGSVETWHFDAATSLPVARIARAAWVGREVESRTFFDDYRQVDGVLLPFHLEIERGNLFAEMSVDDAVLNIEIPADSFSFPRPPLLVDLENLVGTWQVISKTRPMPNLPWFESPGMATIEADFDGTILREKLHFLFAGRPRQVHRTYTHDRFTDQLKIVHIDDLTHHPNIFVGAAQQQDGAFVASNVESGTAWGLGGPVMFERQTLNPVGKNHFTMVWEQSPDGEHWLETASFDYRRADGGTSGN